MQKIPPLMIDNLLTRACQILAEAPINDLERLFGVSKTKIGNPPNKTKIRKLCEQLYRKGDFDKIIVAVLRTQSQKTHVPLNLQRLGGHLAEIKRYKMAERVYKKAFEVSDIVHGVQHLQTGIILADWSGVLYLQNKTPEGLQKSKDAITIFESLHSAEARLYLARTLENLGEVLQHKKQYDKALRHYRKALSIRETHEGVVSFKTVRLIHTIGILLTDLGQLKRSIPYFEKAFLANYFINGLNHQQTIGSLKMIIAVMNTISEQDGDESIYEKYIYYLEAFQKVS